MASIAASSKLNPPCGTKNKVWMVPLPFWHCAQRELPCIPCHRHLHPEVSRWCPIGVTLGRPVRPFSNSTSGTALPCRRHRTPPTPPPCVNRATGATGRSCDAPAAGPATPELVTGAFAGALSACTAPACPRGAPAFTTLPTTAMPAAAAAIMLITTLPPPAPTTRLPRALSLLWPLRRLLRQSRLLPCQAVLSLIILDPQTTFLHLARMSLVLSQ